MTSSRSIYELAQLRRTASRLAAAYQNKTHRHNHSHGYQQVYGRSSARNSHDIYKLTVPLANNTSTYHHHLYNRLKTIIITSCIIVGFMILAVAAYVALRNARYDTQRSPVISEQTVPLEPKRETSRIDRKEIRSGLEYSSRRPRQPLTSV